jgi:hypothetical protein
MTDEQSAERAREPFPPADKFEHKQMLDQLEGLAIGLEQRGEKSAGWLCRRVLAALRAAEQPAWQDVRTLYGGRAVWLSDRDGANVWLREEKQPTLGAAYFTEIVPPKGPSACAEQLAPEGGETACQACGGSGQAPNDAWAHCPECKPSQPADAGGGEVLDAYEGWSVDQLKDRCMELCAVNETRAAELAAAREQIAELAKEYHDAVAAMQEAIAELGRVLKDALTPPS